MSAEHAMSGLEVYWKLPAGFFSNSAPLHGLRACKIVQSPGTRAELRRLTIGNTCIFCNTGWSSAPDGLLPLIDLYEAQTGKRVASAGKTPQGDLYLPFNIQSVIETFQMERYIKSAPLERMRRLYYWLRPLLPRTVQIKFRQSIAPLQNKQTFPAWPLDVSLDNFYQLMLLLVLQVSEIEQIPFIWFWPEGYSNAVVLTHDVETQIGHDNLWSIVNLERKYGFRSLWNFVPERYKIAPGVLADLAADGFEIGVHGLYHDGHLFDTFDIFKRRADRINHYMHEWNSKGFRAPSAIRNLQWIAEHIHAMYDTSCPVSEIYAPQAGGCCSVFPFTVNQMVELPFTMPQDHTLFTILEKQDESMWLEVASQIMARHGLVNIIVHPDYTLDAVSVRRYETFLQWLRQQGQSWFALPKQVAAWWKDRSQQQLQYNSSGWHIDGPSAEQARIACASVNEQGLLFEVKQA